MSSKILDFINFQKKNEKHLKEKYPCLIGRIHPDDDMFTKEDVLHYVNVGLNALQNIEETLEMAGKRFEDIKYCLDMPCGYGRVLRFLKCKIPSSRITACDINEEAVMFCSSEFGAKPLCSSVDFTRIKFDSKYDLIWTGSLFTHIDSKQFSILLTVLYNVLEENGSLIFTTHGEYSIETYGRQFIWGTIPGNENFRLLLFLKNELNINWAENAQIIKTDDDRTIRIFTNESSAEIMLDENKEKAILKISDGRTYDLQVKADNDKLYVYGIHRSPQEIEKLTQTLKNEGYYFASDPGSKNYGASICTKQYVTREIDRSFDGSLKLIRYKYRGWDKHQDVYSFQKIK